VFEVYSSVRLDPPPHPSWPHRRRTDALVKKIDCAPRCGPLGMSDDELSAFIHDNKIKFCRGPSSKAKRAPELPPDENSEEAYWRNFREMVEQIRQLRALHPTAPQLAMSADEITDYYRRLKPGPRTEAQRQADIKFVSRVQPGRKAETRDDKYRVLKQELLKKKPPFDLPRGHKWFVKTAEKRFNVDRKTAENNWSRLARVDAK
jgi:hypothetical protein